MMKKLITALFLGLFMISLLPTPAAKAEDTMQRFYLVPAEVVGNGQGPKYFKWRAGTGTIDCNRGSFDYGFHPYFLVLAKDITQVDNDFLEAQPDVYSFPLDVSVSISPQDNLDLFFEGVGIPTDWLTPATTYIEFLRQLAGMFQFAQRYLGISEGHVLIEDTGGLDSRYRDWDSQTQTWFNATIESFGYDSGIVKPNNKLRQMLKSAGSAWGTRSFWIGGVEF